MQAVILWPPFHPLQAARRDFWTGKDPAEWTPEEKQRLLLQSPWAREGVLGFSLDGKRGKQPAGPPAVVEVPGGRPAGTPGSGPPGGSVPFGDPPPPRPQGDSMGESPQFRVRVRWESARPVRLAGGPELPEDTSGFYVIRLTGMPLMRPRPGKNREPGPDPNLGMLEAIKQNSRIERKNKNPIPCAHLLTGSGDAATELLLFFARGADPITPADREVTVASRFGPFQLSVKFPLKEMMFGGALAL
jgi:hypothetical protein